MNRSTNSGSTQRNARGPHRTGWSRAAKWIPSLSTAPFILAVASILTGLAGWVPHSYDGTFHSIATIIVNILRAFIPSGENLEGGNVLTDVSALLGALTTYSSVVFIAFGALHERALKLLARYVFQNHTVVIGNTVLANRIAAAFDARRERAIQVIPADASRADANGLFDVRHRLEATSLIETFGLRRTRCIVIDRFDDAATLGLARALLARLREASSATRRRSKPRVLALSVADSMLADHFAHAIAESHMERTANIEEELQLSFFDEALMSARDCLARRPLYLLAEERGQRRVHALVNGFSGLGEKLLEEIMLTSLAGDLESPRVTIVTPGAAACERHFRARRPGFANDPSIAFLNADAIERLDDPSCEDAATLSRLEQEDAVTAVFLTSKDDGEIVRTALTIRAVQRRTGRIAAPIFFPEPAAGPDSDILSISPDQAEVAGNFISFGVSDEMLLRQISDPDGRDALARALHEAYISGENVSAAAGKPWRLLPETTRRANYHAADHFRAKLHTLGFAIHDLPLDVIPTLSAEDQTWLFGNAETPRAPEADLLLAKLARLEHERWRIERQLNGWIRAEPRDDARRRHPLLLPWKVLVEKHPQEVPKDRAQIDALLRFLISRGDKSHVVARRDSKALRPNNRDASRG